MKWHHSLLGTAAVAACLGVTTAATLGVGASSALAVTLYKIYGSGSSLQSSAQGVWSTALHKLTNENEVVYTATSSGKGLTEFGDEGSSLTITEDPTADKASPPFLDAFVGSDDPPDAEQLTHAKTASETEQITIPVLQAPVAVILSLPKEITVEAGVKVELSNELLAAIWDKKVTAAGPYAENTWGALLEDDGWTVAAAPKGKQFADGGGASGGAQTITLQARSVGSGTTFTFRDYLWLLDHQANVKITTSYNAESVSDTNATGAGGWPVTVEETGNEKGGQLVEKTAELPGSIGYANLADAAGGPKFTDALALSEFNSSPNHYIAYALIQDNGKATTGIEYANPEKSGSKKEANVDIENEINTSNPTATESSSDSVGKWVDPSAFETWFGTKLPSKDEAYAGTFANDPDVSADSLAASHKFYPIVAVTYDLVWHDYETLKLEEADHYNKEGKKVAEVALEYFKYILESTGGQEANKENFYAPIPTTVLSSVNSTQLVEMG